MAIAPAKRPLIVGAAAPADEVELVAAGAARRPGVARWPVVGDPQGSVGGEGDTERVAQPAHPVGAAAHSSRLAGSAVAKHLPAWIAWILGVERGRGVGVAQSHVQETVGTEGHPAAL